MHTRTPKLGDIIIEHTDKNGLECFPGCGSSFIGLITEIHLDKYGGQRHVLIDWANEKPPEYNDAWGYSGLNIHNMYNRFTLIRQGTEM